MKKHNKKSYFKPKLTLIELDKEISLIMTTEDNPPDNPFGVSAQSDSGVSNTSTDTTEEPLEKNSFEENPFQR